ncbi:MAG: GerW family sporulation protein [Lachnospiraceae bacterium]|nr:GerW family sporulation protein [Lachnospiraceae bacterium]
MSNKDFGSAVSSLFNCMDSFFSSKTVVGEPIKVDDSTTIVPLVDVSFGMGAAEMANGNLSKNRGGGGIGGKMSPSAAIIIQDGKTKLVSVKAQDTVSKIIDFVPEVIDRFMPSDSISNEEVVDLVKEAEKTEE